MRMSEYGSNAEGIREKLTERVKDAQEMRQEIDALKAELAGITGDLDPEITGEIQAAQEQARQEAMSDISGVEQQANQEQQEGKTFFVSVIHPECVFYLNGSDACLRALEQFCEPFRAGCRTVRNDRYRSDFSGGDRDRLFSLAHFHGTERIV